MYDTVSIISVSTTTIIQLQTKLDNLILQKYLIVRPNHSTISLALTTNEVVRPKGAGDNRKKAELSSPLPYSALPRPCLSRRKYVSGSLSGCP